MPMYHFEVHDGGSSTVLASFDIHQTDDVRREAVRQAALQLFTEQGSLSVPKDWRLDVTDEAGQVVFQLVYP